MNNPEPAELPSLSRGTRVGWTTVLVLVGVAFATVGGFLIYDHWLALRASAPRSEMVPVNVRARTLRLTRRQAFYEATGFLESPATLRVPAETAGKLERKLKQEGESVEAGEVLAFLDPSIYEKRVQAARARGRALAAQLEYYRKMLGRAEVLVKSDHIDESELDDWRTKTSSAEASLAENAAQLAENELYRDRCQIKAPRAGVWYEDSAREGEYLQTGSPLGMLRVLDPLEVRVEVPGYARLALSVGQPVNVELLDVDPTLHSIEHELIDCRIAELPAGVAASRRFPVVVHVPNPERKIFPGLFARARFDLGREDPLLLVPKEIVVEQYGQPYVYRLVEREHGFVAELQPVRIRELEDVPASWWVREGLSEGDRVILEPLEQLSPGVRVEPRRGGGGKRAPPIGGERA